MASFKHVAQLNKTNNTVANARATGNAPSAVHRILAWLERAPELISDEYAFHNKAASASSYAAQRTMVPSMTGREAASIPAKEHAAHRLSRESVRLFEDTVPLELMTKHMCA